MNLDPKHLHNSPAPGETPATDSSTNIIAEKPAALWERLSSALLDRWQQSDAHGNWLDEADWAHTLQEPLRARLLLYVMMGGIVILLLWAAIFEIDEVARGQGKVIPSKQLQTLQSFDGGLVENILITEGQMVEKGQILIRIDPTRFNSSLGESEAQSAALLADIQRINAQINGTELELSDAITKNNPQLAQQQRDLFTSNMEAFREEQLLLENQIAQRRQERLKAQAELESLQTSLALTEKELAVTYPLRHSGAVSEIDILRLERDVARLKGQVESTKASVSVQTSAVAEAQNKLNEARFNTIAEWRSKLSEASSKLKTLEQANIRLADKVQQADIRAPIKGTIQRLYSNTVGGILAPGQNVVDIIPADDQLVVEAKVAPKDIAFIKPGQAAIVRVTAYDYGTYGGLKGTVTHISADSITDEEGRTFYIVRLNTEQPTRADFLIIPGMTTQVDIITGKRSILRYLLNPIIDGSAKALTER